MTSSRLAAPSVPRPSKTEIAGLLTEARERTLLLVSRLTDEDLHRQHDPLMSPIIWDVGHIAHFEELWLTQNLDGPIEFSEMPGLYNPFEHPRATRASLALPTLSRMMERLREIRSRVIDRLETVEFDERNPLLRGAYVYDMVLQHEYQHNETMLQTLQLKRGEPYHPPRRRAIARRFEPEGGMVVFDGGQVSIGTIDRTTAYDNERPQHLIELPAFSIDFNPVSNRQYIEFIGDGGYERSELWSSAGNQWRAESGAIAPKYWWNEGGVWFSRTMDRTGQVDPALPVCHVCYHEADAFARWAGKRLPTEFEWEAAASWNASVGRAQRYPWGDTRPDEETANIDQLAFGAAPIGSYERNVSTIGCYGMIGDVWEWTSSDFSA